MGVAVGTALKFYTSQSKGCKLEVKKFFVFLLLILTFVEIIGRGAFYSTILNRVQAEHHFKYQKQLHGGVL